MLSLEGFQFFPLGVVQLLGFQISVASAYDERVAVLQQQQGFVDHFVGSRILSFQETQ